MVFIPQCRKKILSEQLRQTLDPVYRERAERTKCRIEEDHLMIDHVHLLSSILSMVSMAAAMGVIKGKTAIQIARVHADRRCMLCSSSFPGAWVLSVDGGKGRGGGRRYIRGQDKEDLRLGQLELTWQ